MRILLLGKDGQLGWELQRSLAPLGEVCALSRKTLDLEDLNAISHCVRDHRPNLVVNAAAYTAVDMAESEPWKAQAINAEAAGMLAEESRRLNAWLVHYSTDYVFDGMKPTPYVETDMKNPLSVYGKTKCEGEEQIRRINPKHVIFRTSWVYATRGHNFLRTIIRLAKQKEVLQVVADQYGAPTSAELIADVTALAWHYLTRSCSREALAGTYHLTATGSTSWYQYAEYVLALVRAQGVTLKAEEVQPISTEAYPVRATRPRNSRLDINKVSETFGLQLPGWQCHIERAVNSFVGELMQ
jgi:dTDP-4-dehydrorhamnose reductase